MTDLARINLRELERTSDTTETGRVVLCLAGTLRAIQFLAGVHPLDRGEVNEIIKRHGIVDEEPTE